MRRPHRPGPLALATLALAALVPSGAGTASARAAEQEPAPRAASVTARAEAPVLPVLVGNRRNPLLRVRLEVGAQGAAPVLVAATFRLVASGGAEAVRAARALCTPDELPPWREPNAPFAEERALDVARGPGAELRCEGAVPLPRGTSFVWLSVELAADADVDGWIAAACTELRLADGRVLAPEEAAWEAPQDVPRARRRRLGVAVRNAGDDGVAVYRIPAIATTRRGTLVAAYDARRRGWGDLPGDIDVATSRSTDGGRTWEPMRIALDLGDDPAFAHDGVGDPAILYDAERDTLWIAALWSHGDRAWRGSGPGLAPEETGQLVVTTSTDDGVTWSPPRNLTRRVKDPRLSLVLASPGRGVQLADGTLVFGAQFLLPPEEERVPHATILVSRDHGENWRLGTGAKPRTTECQPVELAPGVVMLNARDDRGGARSVLVTRDLGATWEEHPTSRRALPEPVCNAGLLRVREGDDPARPWLAFVNPAVPRGPRRRMTLRLSTDGGASWPEECAVLLDEGQSAGYASLTLVDADTIGVLYESSRAHLAFQRVPRAELRPTVEPGREGASERGVPAHEPRFTDLWVSGEGGYHTYRIPALVALPDGVVLAFCEGRKHGPGDSGDIDLLVRRSEDGGATFGPTRVLWDDGANVCGNPCPVVDRHTGRVHLFATHNLGEDTEAEIIAGSSRGTRTVWVLTSDDAGRTWSAPREITAAVKRADWTWYATGPGNGIQLERGPHAGRLVVPCDHIERESGRYFSHVVLSDDGGKTWRLGGRSPRDAVNESAVVELADGRLLLDMRNYDRSRRTRQVAFSDDGGESWRDQRHDPLRVEPICQASLLRLALPEGDRPGVLLFSNPADERERRRLTLRASYDEGRTWPRALVLHEGAAAYSSIAVLPGGDPACLFEADGYARIVLVRVPREEVLPR